MFYLSPVASKLPTLFGDVQSLLDDQFEVLSYKHRVKETDEALALAIDLPGFDKAKISILREGNRLMVSAEQADAYGSRRYQRSFSLPEYIDLEQIDAEHKDGVLLIVAKKQEESKPKKIPIR